MILRIRILGAEFEHPAEKLGIPRQRGVQSALTALESPGDLDLPISVEQRDGTHFLEIQSNRIVGPAALRQLRVGLGRNILRFESRVPAAFATASDMDRSHSLIRRLESRLSRGRYLLQVKTTPEYGLFLRWAPLPIAHPVFGHDVDVLQQAGSQILGAGHTRQKHLFGGCRHDDRAELR